MSEDWLDTDQRVPALPIELPADYASRARLAEAAWGRLTPNQKTFLSAWRDCRFNERAACRQLGLSVNTKPNTAWMRETDYAMVARVWRANVAANALDKDRLLARQDDIVETLLEPKYILHQGLPVFDPKRPGEMIMEVEAAAAGKANETLMKAAGLLKDKDIEVNVAVAVGPPTLNIQVLPAPPSQLVKRDPVVIDARFTETPSDEDWME